MGIALCAFRILWLKTRHLSILKMPKARLFALAGLATVATVAAQKGEYGIRYVDQNANMVGAGTSWATAARTIDAVSRDLNGGVVYVKPGVYGSFRYHEPPRDGEPLKVVAIGSPEETVIDGGGTSGIESWEINLPRPDAPSPETPLLRIEGFTVRNMNVRAFDQAFDRCIISNFTQGAAYSSSFSNCLIVANRSGSIRYLFDSCIFDNCTVVGNRPASHLGMSGVARDSIFWGNLNSTYYFLNATNCCVEGGAWAGSGNIADNPLFVSAGTGNYRLAEGSPCINAGDDSAAAGDRDLAGFARILDGHVDIGAYEFVRAAPCEWRLSPWTYLGRWELERVAFAGDPPFGGEMDAADTASLLVASVRPASLLQMADMICYPASCATKWEKLLRNLGYGGRRGTYEGEWTGESDEVDAGGGGAVTPPDPGAAPGARYDARVGTVSGMVLDGAAGWDVLGLPKGMTWDRETGTLGGTPVRSGTYDIMLVSGSGADTKLMRTTLEVAGYAVTTGYVGVAFKASGAPWNALASYKTAPSGLAWKKKVLSGTPKKAGTFTYKTKAGEPVKLVILTRGH